VVHSIDKLETSIANITTARAQLQKEANIQKDLESLAVHMEHSSAPSKLISEELKDSPPEGGPGLEDFHDLDRGFRQRQGAYQSYTDRDLVQRSGAGIHERQKRGDLKTEAQAKNSQRHTANSDSSNPEMSSSEEAAVDDGKKH